MSGPAYLSNTKKINICGEVEFLHVSRPKEALKSGNPKK